MRGGMIPFFFALHLQEKLQSLFPEPIRYVPKGTRRLPSGDTNEVPARAPHEDTPRASLQRQPRRLAC